MKTDNFKKIATILVLSSTVNLSVAGTKLSGLDEVFKTITHSPSNLLAKFQSFAGSKVSTVSRPETEYVKELLQLEPEEIIYKTAFSEGKYAQIDNAVLYFKITLESEEQMFAILSKLLAKSEKTTDLEALLRSFKNLISGDDLTRFTDIESHDFMAALLTQAARMDNVNIDAYLEQVIRSSKNFDREIYQIAGSQYLYITKPNSLAVRLFNKTVNKLKVEELAQVNPFALLNWAKAKKLAGKYSESVEQLSILIFKQLNRGGTSGRPHASIQMENILEASRLDEIGEFKTLLDDALTEVEMGNARKAVESTL